MGIIRRKLLFVPQSVGQRADTLNFLGKLPAVLPVYVQAVV